MIEPKQVQNVHIKNKVNLAVREMPVSDKRKV